MHDGPIELGEAGVLAPGRWRWLRALGWIVPPIAIYAGCGALVMVVKGPLHGSPTALMAAACVATALLYAAYVGLVHRGERRAASELAPRALPGELATGLLIGAGMFALVFASLRLLGVYTLARGSWSDWPRDVVQMSVVGLTEELIARAVVFRLLMRAFGAWPALIGSALLFGAAHLGNPNASATSAAATAVEAGLMLAGVYLLTGRLWMSVGVHIAWNLMQGSVFGARVSGMEETGSLFTSHPVPGAPDWISGGVFGPEASVSAVIVGLAVFGATLAATARRKG